MTSNTSNSSAEVAEKWYRSCCAMAEIDADCNFMGDYIAGLPQFEASGFDLLPALGAKYRRSEVPAHMVFVLITIEHASVKCLNCLLTLIEVADLNKRCALSTAGVQETPLHLAVRKHHNTVIDMLLEKDVSIYKVNSLQQTALEFSMVEAPGCLPTLLQHIDAMAVSKKVSRLLKECLDKTRGKASHHSLMLVEKSLLRRQLGCGEQGFTYDVSLTVVGASGSGKSSLLESLTTSWTRGHFRSERKSASWADDDGKRTRCMDVDSFKVDNDITVRYKELGGNAEFSAVHCLFAGQHDIPSVAFVVCSATQSRADIEDQLKSAYSSLVTLLRPVRGDFRRLTTLTVFSRADRASVSCREICSLAYQKLKDRYQPFLNLRPCHFVTALKAWDQEMRSFRASFAQAAAREIQDAPLQPIILKSLQLALPKIHDQLKSPWSSRSQFINAFMTTYMKIEDSLVATEDIEEMMAPALTLLAAYGEIIMFDQVGLSDVIINDPPWLLTGVMGMLCCPSIFPGPRVAFDLSGCAPIHDVATTLGKGDKATGKQVLRILLQLRLCVIRASVVVSPARLPHPVAGSSLVGGWVEDAELVCYAGRALVCDERTPFAAGLPTQLQVAVCAHFHDKFGIACTMLRNTVTARAFGSSAQGCVTFHPGLLEASVVVRGERGSQHSMHALLDILHAKLLELLGVLSPSSRVAEFVLSGASVAQHVVTGRRPLAFVRYTPDEVKSAAAAGNQPLTGSSHGAGGEDGDDVTDRALDLLHLPADHLHLLTDDGRQALVSAVDGLKESGELLEILNCPPMEDRGCADDAGTMLLRHICEHGGYGMTMSHVKLMIRSRDDMHAIRQALENEEKRRRVGSESVFEADRRERRRYAESQANMLAASSEDSVDGLPGTGTREFDLHSLANMADFSASLSKQLNEAERDQLARCIVEDVLDSSSDYRKVLIEHIIEKQVGGPASQDNVEGMLSFWIKRSICMPPTSLHLMHFIEKSTFCQDTEKACCQLISEVTLADGCN